MAALSLRGQKDVRKFLTGFTGSQRYIMDYLIEEVLRKRTPEERDFLMKTSVLERLSGLLCDFVTERQDGTSTLHELERGHLFIVPLDESRQWYRYHHLFAELLRHQLEVTCGAGEAARLHQRASQWFEDRGLPDETMYHALAAKDWERAMRLISLPEVSTPRRMTITMLNWLDLIPWELLREDVKLCIVYLWALLFAGRVGDGEKIIRHLDQVAPGNEHLQGIIATARAFIAYNRGDVVHMEEYAKKALALLPAYDIGTRGGVCAILGQYYIERYFYNEAEPLLIEACDCWQKTGNIALTIGQLTSLSCIEILRGRLHRAEDMLKQAATLVEQNPQTGLPLMYLGGIYYVWNDLEEAESVIQRAIEHLQFVAVPHAYDLAYLYLAVIRFARGNTEGATQALERADRILSERGLPLSSRARNAAYHILFARAQEDPESTSMWVDKLSEYEAHIPVDVPALAMHLLFRRKGRAAAFEHWNVSHLTNKKAGLNYCLAAVLILEALNAPTPTNATTFLAEALSLAKPEGLIRMFVDFGMELAPLLRQAITRGIVPEYAQKLLNIIEFEEGRRKLRRTTPAQDILSERELEVLRLLAAGFSNKEIAGKLVISLNTTKTHIRHLFDKLEAKSRIRAIARAKELRLL